MRHRWLVSAVIAASAAVALPVGLASAGQPEPLSESYPPFFPVDPAGGGTGGNPADPVDPADPGRTLPATGSDSTDTWLKFGTGAVLAGGLLVAATARRRQASTTAPS